MAEHMTEHKIESDLIARLVDLKYSYRPDINSRTALEKKLPREVRGSEPRQAHRRRIFTFARRDHHAGCLRCSQDLAQHQCLHAGRRHAAQLLAGEPEGLV